MAENPIRLRGTDAEQIRIPSLLEIEHIAREIKDAAGHEGFIEVEIEVRDRTAKTIFSKTRKAAQQD